MNRTTSAPLCEQTTALIRPVVDDRAPGRVRKWAEETLARWELTCLTSDLNSVLTELVTNAWREGAGELLVLMELCRARGLLDVAVWDDAPGVPVRREPDPDGGPGKPVWATLRVPADGDAP